MKNWTYSGHVLLADEALDVLVGEDVPQLLGEGRVLHVAVQTDHAAVVLADLDLQRHVDGVKIYKEQNGWMVNEDFVVKMF